MTLLAAQPGRPWVPEPPSANKLPAGVRGGWVGSWLLLSRVGDFPTALGGGVGSHLSAGGADSSVVQRIIMNRVSREDLSPLDVFTFPAEPR